MTSPANLTDPARIAALVATGLLDSEPEERFDRLTRLVSRLTRAPISTVTLIDAARQFYKSQVGLPEPVATARQTPLDYALCENVLLSTEPLVIEDLTAHPMTCEHLAVTQLGARAYLGAPLVTDRGEILGSICAIDVKPRPWTDDDVETVRTLAQVVMSEVALRREIGRRRDTERHLELVVRELQHRVKNAIATVGAVVNLSMGGQDGLDRLKETIGRRIASLGGTHSLLVATDWRGATLGAILTRELEPYFSTAQVTLDGPEITLPPATAVAFGMVIHELVTNAAKYGALSTPAGRLSVTWEAHQLDGEQALRLEWLERGGPAVVAPSRTGFGSRLVERLLVRQLRGRIEPAFEPDGLRVKVDLVVPDAGEQDDPVEMS